MVAIFWCLYSNNGSTNDYTGDYTDDYTGDYTDDSALKFKWIFGPTLKPWYSIEYLVPHWNLDARMNIWSHIETLLLERIICFVMFELCEYLVPLWNLDTRLNIWYHIETLMLEWIFGPTLKPWYLSEYLVPCSNLDTRLNIWSNLETSIFKWMICMDIWWYVCKCNAGPGEMLLMQPRPRSSGIHSCYLFITFDFARQSTCWAVKLTSL